MNPVDEDSREEKTTSLRAIKCRNVMEFEKKQIIEKRELRYTSCFSLGLYLPKIG